MDKVAARIEELQGQQQQLVGRHTALTQELGQVAIQIQRVAGAVAALQEFSEPVEEASQNGEVPELTLEKA